MTNEKYEMIKDSKTGLYRVRALRDIFPKYLEGSITKGSDGGLIERENNLSIEDESWIDCKSIVRDYGFIGDSSYVENSIVKEYSLVWESRLENSKVTKNAVITHSRVINSNVSKSSRVSNSYIRGMNIMGGTHDSCDINNTRKNKVTVSSNSLSIIGGPYKVTMYKRIIVIGCKIQYIDYWKAHYERVKDYAYCNNDEKIAKKYLGTILELHNIHFKRVK